MVDYISERSAGQIVGDSFRLYSRNFRVLFLVYALPIFPLILFNVLARSNGEDELSIAISVIQALLGIFTLGAVTLAVSNICLGNQPSLKRSYAALFRIFWGYLGTYILYLLAFMLGFLLLILPGFYVSVVLVFSLPICIIERRSPMDAIKRSMALSKGRFWRIFGTLMLVGLTIFLPFFVVGFVVGMIGFILEPETGLLLTSLLMDLLGTLLVPFMQVATILIYYDIRSRKEHFDGAALATELMT